MYANFELYSGGWVTADVKRKRARTTTGCLPCRKRKKKCDESWPVCGSCRKRYDCDNCYQSTPRGDATYVERSSPLSSRSGSLDSDAIISHQGSPRRRSSTASGFGYSIEDVSVEIIPRVPFTSVVGATAAIPPYSLPALFHVFDPASHGMPRPESSITSLTIPLTARSPAVFHAMTACSSILLAQKEASWHKVAIQHHCGAVRHLAQEMGEQKLNEPEALVSCMAVVMMLHLFEKFDASSQTASYMHVSAAQDVFLPYLSRPPTSRLGALVLEAYIYHVALNSTFHAEALKDYHHLDALTTTLTTSAHFKEEATTAYRRSLWLELPPELLACIYKISYLRRQTSLSAEAWSEVPSISTTLGRLASTADTFSPHQSSECSTTIWFTRQLYVASARLVLWKLMNLALPAADDAVQSLLAGALRNLSLLQSKSALLWYPLAVLGTAAISERDRKTITSHLFGIHELGGHRGVGNVLKLLAATWSSERRGVYARHGTDQLDVWLDDTLLRLVGV